MTSNNAVCLLMWLEFYIYLRLILHDLTVLIGCCGEAEMLLK